MMSLSEKNKEEFIKFLRDSASKIELWEELDEYSLLSCAEHIRNEALFLCKIQCKKCKGSGNYLYQTTATWHGGAGGNTSTLSVCDRCWGSGRNDIKGSNLRVISEEIESLKRQLNMRTIVYNNKDKPGNYTTNSSNLI